MSIRLSKGHYSLFVSDDGTRGMMTFVVEHAFEVRLASAWLQLPATWYSSYRSTIGPAVPIRKAQSRTESTGYNRGLNNKCRPLR